MKAEAPCAVANLAVAAAPGEEGEEITPQSALVSHSSSIPRSCRKPCTELSPQQEWFISKREFISLSVFFPWKSSFPAAPACPGLEGLLETVSTALAAPAYK